MSTETLRVCRHGSLRRNCEVCDLAEDCEQLERDLAAAREVADAATQGVDCCNEQEPSMSIDYSALGSAKEAELTQLLRQYADVADAGGKSHWATAMRRAASEIPALRDGLHAEQNRVDNLQRILQEQISTADRALTAARARVSELEAFVEAVERQYDDECTPGQLADRLYDVSCRARALLSKEPQP